jgi:hypothetical protein
MTVDSNTYGTAAGLERLIGDIVGGRKFTTDTVPTLVQAEAELDNVADSINSLLDTVGYTVPVDKTDYPFAFGYLAAANEYGAASRLLGTIPTEAYDPDEQMIDIGQTRPQMYERYLNQALKRIRERMLRAGMRKARFADLRAGAATDASGNTKEPLYRRRMDEFPGARILPGEESAEDC